MLASMYGVNDAKVTDSFKEGSSFSCELFKQSCWCRLEASGAFDDRGRSCRVLLDKAVSSAWVVRSIEEDVKGRCGPLV